jgi:hypothetical protein
MGRQQRSPKRKTACRETRQIAAATDRKPYLRMRSGCLSVADGMCRRAKAADTGCTSPTEVTAGDPFDPSRSKQPPRSPFGLTRRLDNHPSVSGGVDHRSRLSATVNMPQLWQRSAEPLRALSYARDQINSKPCNSETVTRTPSISSKRS